MPTIPSIPANPVPLSQLRSRLEKLDKTLTQAQASSGQVTPASLRSAVAQAKDAAMSAALDRMLNCYGFGDQLSEGEVQQMHNALQDAVKGLPQFDQNRDGVVNWGATSTQYGAKMPQAVTEELVMSLRGKAPTTLSQRDDDTFLIAPRRTGPEYEHRNIERSLEKHIHSADAKEAVRWMAREKAVKDVVGAVGLERDLIGAERGFAAHVPLFGELLMSKGHLSDDEVKKFLGTGDLKAYAAEKRAAVESLLGGRSWDAFVDGTILPVADRFRETHDVVNGSGIGS